MSGNSIDESDIMYVYVWGYYDEKEEDTEENEKREGEKDGEREKRRSTVEEQEQEDENLVNETIKKNEKENIFPFTAQTKCDIRNNSDKLKKGTPNRCAGSQQQVRDEGRAGGLPSVSRSLSIHRHG